MVLRITAERELDITETRTDAITVHVDSARILSVVTESDAVATKWLKQVLKRGSVSKTTVLVGVTAEVETTYHWREPGRTEYPYDRLCISTGSHSLICEDISDEPPRAVVDFFANPRVLAVGRDMANLSRRLKKYHMIEIRNGVDLNDLAMKGLKRSDLDLDRCELDGVAKAVLGKQMDVLREYDLEDDWWTRWDLKFEYREPEWFEQMKFSTVDGYLCFMIGLELIDAIDGVSGLKKNKNKNKKQLGYWESDSR